MPPAVLTGEERSYLFLLIPFASPARVGGLMMKAF
jgi:hypothetical protein